MHQPSRGRRCCCPTKQARTTSSCANGEDKESRHVLYGLCCGVLFLTRAALCVIKLVEDPCRNHRHFHHAPMEPRISPIKQEPSDESFPLKLHYLWPNKDFSFGSDDPQGIGQRKTHELVERIHKKQSRMARHGLER